MFVEVAHYIISQEGIEKIGEAYLNFEDIISIQLYKIPKNIITKEKIYLVGMRNGTTFGIDEKSKDNIVVTKKINTAKYLG